MVRTKLINQLKEEINHYIGLPYSKNILKDGKIIEEKFMGGKGSAKEIALHTVDLANQQKIKLLDLSPQQIYNFQKKNKIGIDCSGLICQLLMFYGNLLGKKIELSIRKTSADMLTSTSLSKEIKNYDDIQTGDLIRQKNGRHALFIIDRQDDTINYVDSSFLGRGVKYGQFNLNDKNFANQGIYRLLFLS